MRGSAGAGEHRGGLGQEVVIRNDSGYPMTLFSMGNRTEFPAMGFAGAGSGTRREHRVDGTPVDGMGTCELAPGSRVTLVEAGGGGFGDPVKRDRTLVERDIQNGFVSPAAAKREYAYD